VLKYSLAIKSALRVSKNKTIHILQIIISSTVILSLAGGIAFAATSNNTDTSASNNSTSSALLSQRTALRKAELNIQLSQSQTQALAQKCTAAQKALQAIKTKDEARIDKRKQAYTKLSAKLNEAVTGLQKQGANIESLKLQQQAFNTQANQYLIDAQTYATTLNDLVLLDCTKDPTGFEVTLLSARQLRTQLINDYALIKDTSVSLAKNLTDAEASLNKGSRQ
jgi:hypothetical protein